MRPDPLRLFAAALLAASLASQDTVPQGMLGVEGGGGTGIPFGGSQACRYQVVYDAEELPWSGPRVINGIRIRPDFNSGAATPAKGFLDVSVLVSLPSASPAAKTWSPSATWYPAPSKD